MKTFKLIKKLPFENSPEIGYISKPSKEKDGAHYWNHNWFHPENYPEYWKEINKVAFTLNNVDFYYDETVYGIGLADFQVFSVSISNTNKDLVKSWVHGVFKTKAEATEYALLNTPCLSYNDVMSISTQVLTIYADRTEAKLAFYGQDLINKVKENTK